MNLEVYDKVKLHKTGNPELEGQAATIMGWNAPEYAIVVFDIKPEGYAPAIGISVHCLKKIP